MKALAIIVLLATSQSQGAYRAYKLKVQHYEPTMKKNITRTVMSTLDHLQYEHYNAGYGIQKVTLIDTWYCPGDTGGREICKKPKARKPTARELASNPGAAYDKAKRPTLDYNRQPIIP